jgi:hypothetical protein
MKKLAAVVLMAGVLGFAPGVALTEDRAEKAFREAHELQTRQDQPSDRDAWLRSPEGQRWEKTFHRTPQEPMTVVGPMGHGADKPSIAESCAARWPQNYGMQLFCVKEETKAQQQLDGTYKPPSIAGTCSER